jgi:hypothetical protein
MIMLGDMFNNALKAKVDGVCSELAVLLADEPLLAPLATNRSQSQSQSQGRHGTAAGEVSLFVSAAGSSSRSWWPAELGAPASTGAQNDIRYAYFPAARRLATDVRGHITIYDTQDHQIGGVSQQQSGDASLTFVSQRGLVRLAELPVVSAGTAAETSPVEAPAAEKAAAPPAASPVETPAAEKAAAAWPAAQSGDVIATIERLADLRAKGILSEEEFAAKKADLLDRL